MKGLMIYFCLLLLILPLLGFGEGTRQLEPTNPATTPNRRTRIMFDQTGGSAHRTPFATVNCAEKYRLNVYISDPATEQIFFGFNDGTNTLFYQIKDPDGLLVTGFTMAAVPSSGQGFVTTWDQAFAGPKIGTVNPTGYEPKILTPTKVGNYYFEFAKTMTGGTFTGQDMLYFDISVVQGTNVVNGRLWSKAWQLSDDASGDIVKSYPAKLFVYTDDGIVTQLNINEWNGGTYTTYCNKWGVSNTGNWANDRMSSDSWPGSDLPQYKIFLNNPDINIFPTGQFGQICEVSSHSNCNGSIDILARVNKPGSLTLNLDIAPAGSGPEDVVLTGPVVGSVTCDVWDTITWNGLDGNGNPVQSGTNINIDIDYLNGLTNLPLWDVEDNASGLIVNIVRPAPLFSTKMPIFWDDSKLPGGTVNSLNGCIYPTSITVNGCHSWTSQNENMINTWWYLSEGSSSINVVVIRNPQVDFSFDNNCSGLPTNFVDLSLVPGGYPVSWHWDFGLFGDTSNVQNPTYSFTNSGTYQVHLKVISNDGCIGNYTKPVVIHLAPLADAGIDKAIPFGTNTTLQGNATGGSGNLSYHWEPAALLLDPNVLDPVTVDLSETTDFILTVTDLSVGCHHSDMMKVTIFGGPLGVQLSANNLAVCRGGTSTINAQTGGGSGTYTYSWTSDPVGFTSSIEDITVQPEVTTIYTIVVSDGFSTFTQSITISVYTDPVANAGIPQTIPNGTSTTLSGSAGVGSPPYFYQWSPPTMVVSPYLSSTSTLLLSNSTNFTLTVTDSHGCTATSTVMISISGGPLFIDPHAVHSPICRGESTQLLPFSEGGSGNYTYQWSGPGGFASQQAEPIVSPASTTTYMLVIDDGYSQFEDSVRVEVNQLPQINLIPDGAHVFGVDTILACIFDTLSLDASLPNCNYLWSNGANTPIIQSATTGIAFDILSYTVKVTNTSSLCVNEAGITIIFTYSECTYGFDEKVFTNEILVYPNPGSGLYSCRLPVKGKSCRVEIVDMQGIEVFHEIMDAYRLKDGAFDISLLHSPPGIYLLKVSGEDSSHSARLIKL
ncbi:MAG: T9SS type A sorting domain-containing protein [Bacteroidales bacterium]|nr:T9SS type A sorting domain-containing protein [Bacteroidales bacterium]